MREQVDARVLKVSRQRALRLVRSAQRVVVSRGRGVIEFDRRDGAVDDAELLRAILGPAGNLRAPTVRLGKTLLVGFHADAWTAHLTPKPTRKTGKTGPNV